jgi:hypothetical protein
MPNLNSRNIWEILFLKLSDFELKCAGRDNLTSWIKMVPSTSVLELRIATPAPFYLSQT